MVESYNIIILYIHSLLERIDITMMIYHVPLYNFNRRNLDIEKSSRNNSNRLLAQIISSATIFSRRDGILDIAIIESHTNRVPYPHIQFMLSDYIYWKPAHHIISIFEPTIMMVKYDPRHEIYIYIYIYICIHIYIYMTYRLIYREDMTSTDMNADL